MILPRKFGSLGLLDPFVQHLWTTEDLQRSIMLPLLANHLLHHIEPLHLEDNSLTGAIELDYRLCFIFSSMRPSILNHRDDPLCHLFRAIDDIPKVFCNVVINSVTALQISFYIVIWFSKDITVYRITLNM
ncbi:hypothetical protein BDF21DRAFT_397633 [Thamnidium elegans]|nr:hypothetical protein BDF21DRAFT_397633 [Thamnidium elegans]